MNTIPQAMATPRLTEPASPTASTAHLRPDIWAKVNRLLVAKALGEWSHELLIEPEVQDQQGEWGSYRLAPGQAGVEYRFRAKVHSLDHWRIDKASIAKTENGKEVPLDALRLVLEFQDALGLSAEMLPEYLRELSATLYAAAYKHAQEGYSSEALVHADFQDIETAMMEGHPIFLATNGRIGFNAEDHPRYAPEAAAPIHLHWLAVSKDAADFSCVEDMSYAELLRGELGEAQWERFRGLLLEQGLDPNQYLYLPVHPWQWENRLAQLFAPDIAMGRIVYLGPGDDAYLAQQSIRTLFNTTRPDRHYVKTSLSILNMGFTRGISPAVTRFGPAVNDWVHGLARQDPYLRDCGFSLLREVAFMAYRHRYFEAISRKRSDDCKEMLAAIWRENPATRLRPGQRVVTMAALMHCDREGKAFWPALIRASGRGEEAWVRGYLRCYLAPLVHCFHAHHLLFSPHCENTLIVLENAFPVGVILKDLAEDIGVTNPKRELPDGVKHLALRVPEDVMTLGIFTDAFDCVFRFLAPLLEEHAGFPEAEFWRLVAECILAYQAGHPEYAEEYRRYDLFAPTFIRNCLNRLQLRNHRQMVDLNAAEPADSLQLIGALPNPIAQFRGMAGVEKPTLRKEAHAPA